MNTTPCPQEPREPVLALIRRIHRKKASKKWMPDSIEITVRVADVQPMQITFTATPIYKWTQVGHHAEFKGATAYRQAQEFAALLRSGATKDTGASCFADKGASAQDAAMWKRCNEVEVLP